MFSRLFFALIAVFWLTMNVLLWRAEFGTARQAGSPVSTDVVLEKIMTAPDDSTLEITQNGKRIGYCHWYPDPGEDQSPQTLFATDYVPDGMVRTVRGYTVKMDGHLTAEQSGARLRFNFELRLSTNRVWQELTLRVGAKPSALEVKASAPEQTLSWKYEDGDRVWSRTVTFQELRDPRKLLEEVGGLWAAGLVAQLVPLERVSEPSLGLDWEARTDWMRIGSSRFRIYRLQARLLDRYQAVLFVNRVGEIMRVELPNGLRLVNEALTSW